MTTNTDDTLAVQDRPVSEFMTRHPMTLGEDTTIVHALAAMRGHGVHFLPVVDATGWCLGVVSTDTLAAALHHESGGVPVLVGRALGRRVNPRLPADSTLRHAAGVMSRAGACAVPVVDGDGRLIGMLTNSDVVAALAG